MFYQVQRRHTGMHHHNSCLSPEVFDSRLADIYRDQGIPKNCFYPTHRELIHVREGIHPVL